MASETLSFDIFANDRASDTFRRLGESASGVSDKVSTLGDRLDKLGSRVATARVALDGNKDASAQLDQLDVKLLALGRKTANPNISVEGVARAQADISKIDLALDHLNDKTAKPSLLSRLLPGGGGGSAGGAAGAGGGALSGLPLVGALPAPAAIGAIAAALAALPFIAQAAATAITLGLGGALAGIAIYGALKVKAVKDSFADLEKSANADLVKIGAPFVPVLESIFSTASKVLGDLTPVFAGAAKIIAGPFKLFADTLLKAFSQPAVATSIKDIAAAFGDILKALAPQLPGDIADIATGVTRIANVIKANPRAFADFISFLFEVTGFALSVIASLSSIANYIEKHFIPALGDIRKAWDDSRAQTAVILDGMRHDTAHTWDQVYSNTIGTVIRLVHDVETWYNSGHEIAVIFDGMRHDIAAAWDAIWSATASQVQGGIDKVVIWFNGMPGRILKALFGLGHSLYGFAHDALDELWSGFKAVGGSILSWIGNFVGNIIGDVKKLLGIGSPSAVFFDIGKNLMLGLEGGIKSYARNAATAATGAVGSLGGPASASAAQAQAYARSRLSAFGWGASEMAPLIALWNQESGWNRLAQNPTSGAYGIPQALPPSKMGAAANPPTSSAAAQINWGLGYIRSVYGSPSGAEAHENAVHWYGKGLPGGIFRSPTLIGVGERGPEMVTITPASSGRGGGNTYNISVLVPVSANKADTGRQVVEAIREFERRSGSGWRN